MREKKFLFAVYTNFCIIMSDRLISKWAFFSLRICLCCVCVVAHSSLVKTSAMNTQMHAWTSRCAFVNISFFFAPENTTKHACTLVRQVNSRKRETEPSRLITQLQLFMTKLSWVCCANFVSRKAGDFAPSKKKHNETWWESLAGYLFAVSSRDLHGSQ